MPLSESDYPKQAQPNGVWIPEEITAGKLSKLGHLYRGFGGYAMNNQFNNRYLVNHREGLQKFNDGWTHVPEFREESKLPAYQNYLALKEYEKMRKYSEEDIKKINSSGIGILTKTVNPYNKISKIRNMYKQSHKKFSARKRKKNTTPKRRTPSKKMSQKSTNRQQSRSKKSYKKNVQQSKLRRHVFRQGCKCAKCKKR